MKKVAGKKKGKMKSATYLGFMFAIPAVVYMLVFIGYPMIQNLILSIKDVNVFNFSQPANQSFSSFLLDLRLHCFLAKSFAGAHFSVEWQ